MSSALKKDHEPSKDPHTASRLNSVAVPEESSSQKDSPERKPRKSPTEGSQQTTTGTEASGPSTSMVTSNESTPPKEKDHEGDEKERKGLFGRIRAKVHQSKEEKKEKERAKSPPPTASESGTSKQSLNALASTSEGSTNDKVAEKLPENVAETKADPQTEAAEEKVGEKAEDKA